MGLLDPESIRDEKVKVLKAIQPLSLKASGEGGDVVRARYTSGIVNGDPVAAYMEESGIGGIQYGNLCGTALID